jgi:succinate-semialdehyde dehydrogenase / glutarate-semialdehyde dehydrogenase
MTIASINPTTEETLRTFAEHSDAEVEARLVRAWEAFERWRRTSMDERAAALQRLGDRLSQERERHARMMTEEMGKTYASALDEVDKCARCCRHYAEQGATYLADQGLSGEPSSLVRNLPLGPVLAVMPWNFPFWQVFRFAVPALTAGNVGLLKHASNVPQCALAIEDLFARAGFPPGVFATLLVGSARVERLIDDPRIRAVTLTGSEAAGVSVGGAAGRNLKKTVLELGGSDPFVVMPSADLEAAVRTAVAARIVNNGQSCIAAKRFIVHRDVYRPFVEAFVAGLAALHIGDPMHEHTDIGPLATREGRDQLERQVSDSVMAGARLLTGGRRVGARGWFYAVSALADIPRNAPAYHEEVFGPVALLFEAQSLEQAIALANDSPYGLGSSVWTHDESERRRFIDEIEAGQTFVNAMVVSDPRRPFGGVKRSGHGRELGALGILEFVNRKTVVLERGAAPPERPSGRGSQGV